MAITILPAQPSDASTLVPIGLLAFSADPLNCALLKLSTATPAQLAAHLQWRIKRNERRMAGPGGFWFKAVDSESGEVLGFTGALAPEVDAGAHAGAGALQIDGEVPEVVDREFMGRWERGLDGLKEECLGARRDYWYIASMVVHPNHQGRGIGRKLLDAICELADRAGQDIYLEASEPGKRLYEKAGFVVLGEKRFLEGVAPVPAMLRKPRGV